MPPPFHVFRCYSPPVVSKTFFPGLQNCFKTYDFRIQSSPGSPPRKRRSAFLHMPLFPFSLPSNCHLSYFIPRGRYSLPNPPKRPCEEIQNLPFLWPPEGPFQGSQCSPMLRVPPANDFLLPSSFNFPFQLFSAPPCTTPSHRKTPDHPSPRGFFASPVDGSDWTPSFFCAPVARNPQASTCPCFHCQHSGFSPATWGTLPCSHVFFSVNVNCVAPAPSPSVLFFPMGRSCLPLRPRFALRDAPPCLFSPSGAYVFFFFFAGNTVVRFPHLPFKHGGGTPSKALLHILRSLFKFGPA